MASRPKKVDTEVNELQELKKMMADVLKKQEALEKENMELKKTKEDNVAEQGSISEINPNKRVKLIHMLQGGTTLKNHKARVRFESLFQARYAKYEDVEDFRHGDYREIFEDGGIFVAGKANRQALMLDHLVDDQYKMNEKLYDDMLKLKPQELVVKLKSLSEALQTSFATYFIDLAKENHKDCIDRNKWDALSTYFTNMYDKQFNFGVIINE